ncbi:MAG: asparagine synthase (glutamine-hydrolyzing) [Actinomycetota bacterium]|nr:asparagine synthase (glutamine-hydrolyzing) [Actinomycetota bacterium]
MCGIAGICFFDGRPVDEQALRQMATSIAHRGPDGEGIHIDDGARASVGLASRRLAVIDVEGGDQPMSTEDGAYTIIYNGELFNAAEVRRELESRRHRFRTRCDTEVFLRGYAEWGEAVLDRLNGMWAVAIWDARNRRLFLARDRLGVKPLVYARIPDGLVFASEIKALAASGLVARELDPQALPHYLSFFAIPEPHSLVRGVRRLSAGHSLTVDSSGAADRQYWDCALAEEDDQGMDSYSEEVETLLDDSVHRRMVSDVPLGVLLSAGVDSSLVATFAARHTGEPLRTFTLGFGKDAGDEREAARQTAQALGAEHTESEASPREIMSSLPTLLDAYDEPGQSLLQTHLVCSLATRDVTVALSGLGGDELFSAYPSHVVANLMARFDRLPEGIRTAGMTLAGKLSRADRLSRAANLAAMEPDQRATRRLMHETDPGLRSDLLAADIRSSLDLDAPVRHLEGHFARAAGEHPLNRMLYVYVKTYLTDELLRASDAMSMHQSLELRTPFLDYRLVERAMRMPARHKMRFRTGKLVLREVGQRVLPVPMTRRKQGFSPPMGQWIREELAENVRDVLAPPAVRRRGLFDPKAVDRVVRNCFAGDDRAVPPVMMLYSFEAWARRWLDGEAAVASNGASSPASISLAKSETERDLSVIVVNWNTRELLRNCLASLGEHLAGVDHEVIVVDNASSDGSAAMVEEHFPDVRLIQNTENVGFGRANNQAMRVASGQWFLLLNSDTILLDDSVTALFQRVRAEPGIGVAQCRLELPDGRTQHSAYRFPSLRLAVMEGLGLYKLMPDEVAGSMLLSGYWDYSEERDVDWVAGAFMLMPREVFEQTGGFDERHFMYGEDLEWCFRIRDQGWRIRYYPDASIKHFDHSSSDLRWGDNERVVRSLKSQREIYRERYGGARLALFTGLGVTGAALRTGYYSLRRRAGGPRAEAYADMQKQTAGSLRVMLDLIRNRR